MAATQNLSKLRVDLRFFSDLIAIGVVPVNEGLRLLAGVLQHLVATDRDEHQHLNIIITFCRFCGDDWAGLVPRKFRILSEKYPEVVLPRSDVLPAEKKVRCRMLLKEYYTTVSKHLLKDYNELKATEKTNAKIMQTKGEVNQERRDKLTNMRSAFEKLLANVEQLAELLDEDLPEFPTEKEKDGERVDIFCPDLEFQFDGDTALFEDEDTRQFYESLPDLKAMVPGILLKDAELPAPAPAPAPTDELNAESGDAKDAAELTVEEVEKELAAEEEAVTSATSGGGAPAASGTVDEEHPPVPQIDDDDDTSKDLKLIFEAFVNELPNCVNRELIDRAAEDFTMNMNSKGNRRKLVRALVTVHRNRYDLLPFYSRLVATLRPIMADLCDDVVRSLWAEFIWHYNKKDQINIESKLKTSRFIGELVKFGVFPKERSLDCLKLLLRNFTHHNIEMACALLDTCGRYLFRSKESHQRTAVYLQIMMRKRASQHMDQRYSSLIENAYYYCNPPESQVKTVKERPPMHEYLRKLIYKDLNKHTTETVLKQLRKVPWDECEVRAYTTKCLTAVWNIRYSNVACLASLLAGLAPYHETVAVNVVDSILEDVRIGMEMNHPSLNQRRVAVLRYLGELYNYRLVESGVIFRVLYSLLTFGVSWDENVVSPLDPPEHLFRVRLACTLLDTCGVYFDRGASKKKLDNFLVYLQKYYWMKFDNSIWSAENRPFPADVKFLFYETIEVLRPKFKFVNGLEEAKEAVEAVEKEYRSRIEKLLPKLLAADATTRDEWLESIQEEGLPSTAEEDEDDDDDENEDDEEGSDVEGNTSVRRDRHNSEAQSVTEPSGAEDEDEPSANSTIGLRYIPCQEDDFFQAELEKMQSEQLLASGRSADAAKLAAAQAELDLPRRAVVEQVSSNLDSQELVDTVPFTLMLKKGAKQHLANISLPADSDMAKKYLQSRAAEAEEKERVKRAVLNIHEQQAEEEAHQEAMALMGAPHSCAPINSNRERRQKYQHPRGAPDADLIFGTRGGTANN